MGSVDLVPHSEVTVGWWWARYIGDNEDVQHRMEAFDVNTWPVMIARAHDRDARGLGPEKVAIVPPCGMMDFHNFQFLEPIDLPEVVNDGS